MNLQKVQNYEKKRNLVFVLTILFSTIYLLWRIFFTLPWSAGTLQMAAGIVLVMAETSTTLGLFELLISRMRSGNYALHPPKLTKKEFPHVDEMCIRDRCPTVRNTPTALWRKDGSTA